MTDVNFFVMNYKELLFIKMHNWFFLALTQNKRKKNLIEGQKARRDI